MVGDLGRIVRGGGGSCGGSGGVRCSSWGWRIGHNGFFVAIVTVPIAIAITVSVTASYEARGLGQGHVGAPEHHDVGVGLVNSIKDGQV